MELNTKKIGLSLKRYRIIYKNLKKVWGYANTDNKTIEMDKRARGKKHLEISVHESLHLMFPYLDEEEIESKSIILTNTLWHEKYRRVDDTNHQPLQDGSK